MDCMQFVISGPEDTPYSGGLFLFDTFFPSDYPSSCPKVHLQTTGQGSVRDQQEREKNQEKNKERKKGKIIGARFFTARY